MKSTIRTALAMALTAASLAAADSTQFAEREVRYHLQPNDEVEVRFKVTPEFNDTVVVQPDGYVALPECNEAQVGGLTVADATTAIEKACSEKLRNPIVTLLLKSFEKPHIIVSGEVKTPGKYDYRQSLTVMQGLAIAGGLNDGAKKTQVVLFRPINNEIVESHVINLKKMYSGQSLDEDVALKPGDILVVPKNKMAKVQRFMEISRMSVFLPIF